MSSLQIPATGSAEVHVLHTGYVVVDLGTAGDRDALVAALFPNVIIPGHGAPFRPGTTA
jgi:hypothetical protein